MTKSAEQLATEATELVKQGCAIFANQDRAAIGTALVNLAAIWLVGHHIGEDEDETARMREDAYSWFGQQLLDAVPVHEKLMKPMIAARYNDKPTVQ